MLALAAAAQNQLAAQNSLAQIALAAMNAQALTANVVASAANNSLKFRGW